MHNEIKDHCVIWRKSLLSRTAQKKPMGSLEKFSLFAKQSIIRYCSFVMNTALVTAFLSILIRSNVLHCSYWIDGSLTAFETHNLKLWNTCKHKKQQCWHRYLAFITRCSTTKTAECRLPNVLWVFIPCAFILLPGYQLAKLFTPKSDFNYPWERNRRS